MDASAKNRHRPAILVERRGADKLVVQRGVNRFPNFEVVVGFQNLFPAIIQIAVACQNAGAAGGEKCDAL